MQKYFNRFAVRRVGTPYKLTLAQRHWENKDFDESSIVEMLVDGNIEVVEIVKEL